MTDTIQEILGALKELKTATVLIVISPLLLLIGLLGWQTYEIRSVAESMEATMEKVVSLEQNNLILRQRYTDEAARGNDERERANQAIEQLLSTISEADKVESRVLESLIDFLEKSK